MKLMSMTLNDTLYVLHDDCLPAARMYPVKRQ